MEQNSQNSGQPMYTQPQPKKSRWWLPILIIIGIIIGFFVIIGAIIGGVAAGIGGLVGNGFSSGKDETVSIKDNSILHLTFSQGVQEYNVAGDGLFNDDKGLSFIDVLSAIRHAKTDNKIKGLYFRTGVNMGFAKQREILSAIEDFKKSGKFFYAFLSNGSEKDYYIASLADSIFVPQESMMEFNGFGGSTLFLKNMFDKLGVEYTVIQREEYKSAGETVSRTNFSAPAKEEVRAILDQRYTLFVNDVARYRKMDVATIKSILDRGIYDPDSMKALKLIDVFATDLQMKDFLKKKLHGTDTSDSKLRLVGLDDYITHIKGKKSENLEKGKEIAIIYGSGAIRSGRRNGVGNQEIASGSYVRDLRKAADDDDISAIILRIDSPGGSVEASEEIWYEIQRAKAKKPVYASMSDVAASGGYYMAMACDTIIAHPETITGSIGVIAAIPNFSKTCDKLGFTFDTITTGKGALFLDPGLPRNPQDVTRLESMIQSHYESFLQRVATSRKTTPEKIREVARGRVWVGSDAKNKGLVDVLGGMQTSIEIVKKRLGVALDKKVVIRSYPEKEDGITALIRFIKNRGNSGDSDDDQQIQAQVYQDRAVLVEKFVASQNPVWQQAWKSLPPSMKEQFSYSMRLMDIAQRERCMAVMPFIAETW